MCDAEGGNSIRNYEEKEKLILEFLEENDIEGEESIYEEDLYRNMRCYQELKGKDLFNIKQRTPEHFYCPDLGMTLQQMLFHRTVIVKTECIGGGFEHFWGITDYGKEKILEMLKKCENKED